jgi:transcriptional regulator with XRE-family HTH domain
MSDERSVSFAACFTGLLEDACRRLGKQKKELAFSSGVRPDYFSKLQRGDRRPHDPDVVIRIAAALHLDLSATNHLLEAAGFQPLAWMAERPSAEVGQAVAFRHDDGPYPPMTGLLVEAARLSERQIHARLAWLGITYPEAAVVICLLRTAKGQLTMSDLARTLAISPAVGTFTVSRLQGRGMVRRIAEADGKHVIISSSLFLPSPRRSDDDVIVSLTETGRALEQPIVNVFESVERAVRRFLTDRSVSGLRRIVDNFAAAR